MEAYNNEFSSLKSYAKSLHARAGQFNMYVCFCHNINHPEAERLKSETEKIKQIILNIESELDKL